MPLKRLSVAALAAVALLITTAVMAAEPSPDDSGRPVSFYRDIRPIFQENCLGCHQPARRDGKLDMATVEALLKGGETEEPGFEPGNAEESMIVILLEDGSMPKDRDPLPPDQIALIRRWIDAGAEDDTPATAKTAIDQKNPPHYSAAPQVTALEFSPDGSLLAVSGYHEVLLHKTDGSGIVGRLVGLSERIESVAFSPDGTRLAVAGGSPSRMGEVQIWNVAERELEVSQPVTYDTLYGASWSPDGKLLAFGCSDNTLRAIDTSSGEQVFFQGAHEDWVLDTVFSKDGSHLISVSRDRSMKLSEVATERFIDNITSITPGALKGGLAAVDRHPARDELLSGGADGTARIYRMVREKARQIGDDFNLIREFEPLPGRIFDLSYSRDGGRILVVSSHDGGGEARIYQEADGKLVSRFQAPACGLFAAAFHPDGRSYAVGGFDGSVRLIKAETGELVTQFTAAPLEDAPSVGAQGAEVSDEVAGIDHSGVSYIRDIVPAMSKMGCNAGTCHGSAKGKNGFKLSLRGYDPAFDHRALTDDLAGRRYNRAAPDQSLMLLKASGSVPHTGGVLTRPGERRYELLRRWIVDGVKLDLDAPRVTSIEVEPASVSLSLPEMTQQFSVRATYSDGTVRDVSEDAFVESSQTEVLKTDAHGLATAIRRGEAAVLARYEGAYAVAQVTVMGDRSGFEWAEVPTNNHIDELVYAKLQRLKIQPSGICTDAEFLRRVYLDLTGLPPLPDEVRAFLDDSRPARQKRDDVIDRLIGSPEFIEYWTNKWADLLQVNRELTSLEVAEAMRSWIRQALAENRPYNEFAYAVLTGSGSTKENPAAAYYQVLRTPEDAVENSTQLFLGVRFNCNKCHDHPFERWTQRQYYELAAYFAQIKREIAPGSAEAPGKGGNQPDEKRGLVEVVSDLAEGEMKHPNTGMVVAPALPYDIGEPLAAGLSRREQFARWATSAKNQYFATSYVNRIWSYLLGVGLIEPVDDIRAGNPPSNPELLQRLTRDFIDGGFDTRELMRTICKSRVYQHAIETNAWNADDETNYSHALARRLPAEALFDALYRVTGAASHLPGIAAGGRAVEAIDPQVKSADGFLDLFGRPPRESACECERSSSISLSQTLNLVNGPTIAEAINDPGNAIAQLVTAEPDDRRVIEELFLRLLCRLPSEAEIAAAMAAMRPEHFDVDYAQFSAARDEHVATLDARQPVWEKQYQKEVVWQEAMLTELAAEGDVELKAEGNVVVAGGANPEKTKYTVTIDTDAAAVTGVRLEVLPHDSLPAKGPGRAANGNFVLNELTLSAAPKGEPSQSKPIALANAQASFSQESWAVIGAIDGNPSSGWAVAPQFGQPQTAVFETVEDIAHEGGSRLVLTFDQQFGSQHTIGRFRLSLTSSARPLKLKSDLPQHVLEIVTLPRDRRTEEQQAILTAYFRGLDSRYQRLEQAVASYAKWQEHKRVIGAQDLAWALINSPAFLFNR